MLMTHALRAGHEAILVGVGTIVSDDPQLNARFPVCRAVVQRTFLTRKGVQRLAPRQPQPVVLDPDLRCPATARILRIAKPWIYCNASADAERAALLEALGASVTRIVNPSSMHEKLDIAAVLRHVRSRGIKSVMIEGGATIIGQLYQSQLVHRVIITIAPVVVGGLHISTEPGSLQHGGGLFRKLHNVRYDIVGSDIVVSGFLSPHLSQLTK